MGGEGGHGSGGGCRTRRARNFRSLAEAVRQWSVNLPQMLAQVSDQDRRAGCGGGGGVGGGGGGGGGWSFS